MAFQPPTLLEHQELVADFITTRPCSGIYLAVGGAKTLSTLESLFRTRPAGHILIVAPKNIARSTWLDEVDKWGYPLRMKSLIVNENDKMLSREARLARYKEIQTDLPTAYLINQELLADLVAEVPREKVNVGRSPSGRIKYKERILWPFPTVIIDESQGFKNPSSTRVKALVKVRGGISRMVQLTGTPTPNGLLDLWSQVFLLDQGAALGTKFSDYREKYFDPKIVVDGRPVSWEIKGQWAEEEIYSRIGHLVMSSKNTTLPIPPVTLSEYKVHMQPDLLAAYKDFAKQSVLDLVPSGTKKKEAREIVAANAGALRTKLLQFASGTLYLDRFDENGDEIAIEAGQRRTKKGSLTAYEVLHAEKIAMLDYLIRNTGGSPMMVPYRYRSDHSELVDRLAELGHDVHTFDGSRAMVKAWNEGRFPVMLLQPASAGHGLNLQDGGHDITWYTLPDSLEHWIQTNGRLARLGQKHPVTINTLVTANTLDAKQPGMLAAKAQLQDRLVEAVRHYLPQGPLLSDTANESEQLLDEMNEVLGDLDLFPM